MISIKKDETKCLKEGLCTQVCPLFLWRKTAAGIEPHQDHDLYCISCGHCTALCPGDALHTANGTPNRLTTLPEDWRGDPQQIQQILKGRRSTRLFKQQPVSAALLNNIVEVASTAPSSCNRHQLQWLIVSDKQAIQSTSDITIRWLTKCSETSSMSWFRTILSAYQSGMDPICRQAPHLLITTAPNTGIDDYVLDSAIALTFAEIAAIPYGLSACWAGFLMNVAKETNDINRLLNIPADQLILGCLMIGYPQAEFRKIPPREKPGIEWL